MTAFGKMLVFLVLLLSLVWNGLVVNAYVTRSNWRAEAKKYQDKAVEAAESATNLKKLLDAEKEAGEDGRRILRQERDSYYGQLSKLQDEYAKLDKTIKEGLSKDLQLTASQDALKGNIKLLADQVDAQAKALTEKEKIVNKLTLDRETALQDRTTAELQRDAQTQRADRFADRLRELSDQLNELKNNAGKPVSPGTAPRLPVPAGFRGTVQSRDGLTVAFTPGLDAGLKPNMVMTIQRLDPPKYVGKVIVLAADPKEGVGRFVPPPGSKLGADDYPKAGDELKPE